MPTCGSGRATLLHAGKSPPGGSPPSPRRRPAPDRGRSIPAPDRHRQSARLRILRMNSHRFAPGDGIALAQRGVVQLTVQTVGRMGRQQLQLPRICVAMPLVGLQPHRMRRTVGVTKSGDGRRVDLYFTARRFQRVGPGSARKAAKRAKRAFSGSSGISISWLACQNSANGGSVTCCWAPRRAAI